MIIVVSSKDGRVVPWFTEGNPPEGFVEVPKDLLVKYRSGQIKDGFELAQKSLAYKAGYKADEAQEKPAITIPLPVKEKEPNKVEAPMEKVKKVVEAETRPFGDSPFTDAIKTRA
jgi:hypothetical protein